MFLECTLSLHESLIECGGIKCVFDAIWRQIEASGLFVSLQIEHHFLDCIWRVFSPVVSMWFLFSACGALVSVSFVYYYSTKAEWWFPHCLQRQWSDAERVGEGTTLLTQSFIAASSPIDSSLDNKSATIKKVVTICGQFVVIMWCYVLQTK